MLYLRRPQCPSLSGFLKGGLLNLRKYPEDCSLPVNSISSTVTFSVNLHGLFSPGLLAFEWNQ